ncbi:MAG: nicotinate-nucleotide--dimethylbenzimidazole phosphoribosyltransferase [Gammaproteobacteria bacterium]|nr:nicotinate-nucleotide--dimethylbenzimidazole phosphoribosyltransferase [Gammaproteobacteria bacterium]
MSFKWLESPLHPVSTSHQEQALARQGQLTKPPGSLGRLEQLAVQLAALQGTDQPGVDPVRIVVFAADHGIVEEGVSAFPQAVTVEMVKNFSRGGAAISVLARSLGARLEVVNVGTAGEVGELQGVINQPVAQGTRSFLTQSAMDEAQLGSALAAGRDAVARGVKEGMRLFIGGDMGIGNTTAATAVACALLGLDATELAGPGTGLDEKGVAHKAEIMKQALSHHQAALNTPLDILQHVGGFEIAALAGAYIHAAQQGVPSLVDGFIATSAALAAVKLKPELADWLLLAHASAEPGHRRMVEAMGQAPLLDLGMRLGEGSGAAVAVNLLRSAVDLHNNMATFAEAGVSEGD